MAIPSMYTPEGAFRFLLLVLAGALLGAVGYLLAFTDASVPL